MPWMKIEAGQHTFWMVKLPSSGPAGFPNPGQRFPLLLIDLCPSLPADTMGRVAKGMVAAGCKYAVCVGKRAAEWEAAFDNADIEINPKCEEDRLVMTVSNKEDELDEAIEFFFFQTSTDVKAEQFMVALIDPEPEDYKQVRKKLTRAALRRKNG